MKGQKYRLRNIGRIENIFQRRRNFERITHDRMYISNTIQGQTQKSSRNQPREMLREPFEKKNKREENL